MAIPTLQSCENYTVSLKCPPGPGTELGRPCSLSPEGDDGDIASCALDH